MTSTALDRRRVLIVEDEYFIASDLTRALKQHGAEVVGPAGDMQRGLSLAASEQLDAAVLDVNLQGAASFAIADRLAASAVPFVFLTGYDSWSLPDAYRDLPHLAKPFTVTELIGTLKRLCAQEVAA